MKMATLLTYGLLLAVTHDLGAQEPKERLTLKGHPHGVETVLFSHDGKIVATVSAHDRTVKLWELSNS
jgi:WD40 repeat protein